MEDINVYFYNMMIAEDIQVIFFILFYCAFGVYKMYEINYKIVPETIFNKYLHYGTSGSE